MVWFYTTWFTSASGVYMEYMSNKKRVQFSFGKDAEEALELLKIMYPPLSKNNLVELSLIACAKQGGLLFKGNVTSINGKPTDLTDRRDQWCKNIGGEVKAGICYATKYDVALNGRVTALRNASSLKELPEDKDEFMRYFLGPYESLKEAKAALAEQDKKDAARLMKKEKEQPPINEKKNHEKAVRNASRDVTNPEASNAKQKKSMTEELARLEALKKNHEGTV